MKLKLTYLRSAGPPVDIVVTTGASATAGDLARELLDTDPLQAERPRFGDQVTIEVSAPGGGQRVAVPSERAIGEVPIASGCHIAIAQSVAEEVTAAPATPAARLRVVAGPDVGHEVLLHAGTSHIGRDLSCEVVLSDPFVSKRHARVEVGSVIEVVDLNSANGVVVDGQAVSRLTVLPGQVFSLGDCDLTISAIAQSGVAPAPSIRNGSIPFHRSPRVEGRYPHRVHPRPQVPSAPEPPMFAWMMLLAPIIMGVSMYIITGRLMSLLFVAMAPLMMAGNYINTRKRNQRQLQSQVAKFESQLDGLQNALTREREQEVEVRRREAPSVAEVFNAALERTPLLWTRRPEHWSFLVLRLGSAQLASRNAIAPAPEIDEGMPEHSRRLTAVEEANKGVAGVPLVESGMLCGALGIAGASFGGDAARGLLVQLCGLHSPADVVVVALTSPAERGDWDWMRWLPHATSPQSPMTGIHLADTEPTISKVLSELESLATGRLGRRADEPPRGLGPLAEDLSAVELAGHLGQGDLEPGYTGPVVVVLVTEHAPVDRSRLTQLADRAFEAGVLPIWLAADPHSLPAVCRTFLDVSGGLGDADAHFVRHGRVVNGVAVEGVSPENAMIFAMALAPLIDSGAAVADVSDLPTQVSLVELVGDAMAESAPAVLDRWRQNHSINAELTASAGKNRTPGLRALVGQVGKDAMHLDLRSQGPHALVGGTTGSGKSEFLQAWVLSMALEYSPDRVTFLFVDYKGGAAFSDCVRLPHCVGLVTDLSPHLVRRALTSLRAELHFRERLINRRKVKSLIDLERRGDPETPPSLVLVIDEFAALSKEVPEFVDGVVDIAQRGRSLGIHLIMATQRPAGVIRDNLRANTNLRIALRMADEADSSDVIGVSHAAAFDPGTPGRAMAKSGPGRLEMFQSAYAGGHSQVAAATVAKVGIHELRFGAIDSWRRPDVFEEASLSDLGPTDQQRLVASVGGAARLASVASPRRPWLPDLSKIYDLELLAPRSDAELILGVADFPDRQAQELCYFRPDVDGNLAIYGTAGSGKSAALRTLGVAAGITPRGGPVHVYGLDFGAGGLRMLESLPQVGAVVAGDDHERVVRLLRNLRELADARGRAFPSCHAGNITEYRRLAGRPDEARILLLIDNFPAFREAYEVGGSRQQYYVILQQLLSEGRSLGIHVVFTADRHASVPGSMAAAVPRRVVLRLAEDVGYMALGVPNDVLDLTSPPGRAIIDGQEVQLALFGGSGNVADQSEAIGKLAADMRRRGIPEAPPVLSLPQEIPDASLPSAVNGWPVLGVSDETLEPVGFEPVGSFIVGGGPGSGRSNALLVLARSLRCWDEDLAFVYLGGRRSALPDLHPWDVVATDVQEVADVAKQLTEALAGPGRTKRMAIFIEGVSELVTTVADAPLVQLARAVKRSEHLIVAESETATWASIYPLYAELKSSRRGILLQPDHLEGDAIMKTPFPRAHRSEFPVGRGMAVMAGRATRVQVPLATGERSPSPGSPRTSTVETRASNANQLPNQEDQDVQR